MTNAPQKLLPVARRCLARGTAPLLLLLGACGEPVGPAQGPEYEIAFFTGGHLHVMSADGAHRRQVTEGPPVGWGFDWSPDGSALVFTRERPDGGSDLYRVAVDGRDLRRLTDSPGTKYAPRWSPDGRWIAFQSYRDNWEIWRVSASGADERNLTATSVAEGAPLWSPDGTRILFDVLGTLYVMGADGSAPTALPRAVDCWSWYPAWSPDGSRITFAQICDGFDVYSLVLSDGSLTNLTRSPERWETRSSWSPDGEKIAFESWASTLSRGPADIHVMRVDGSGQIDLTSHPSDDFSHEWSPDGATVVFLSRRDGERHIYVAPAGGGEARRLSDAPLDPGPAPRWRPRRPE